MGPAAFWVISSVCDNDSRLCFCCLQKTFHLGRGRMAGKEGEGHREAQGQKVCSKWAQLGRPRGREGQEAGGAGRPRGQGERGRTESCARQARAQTAHCLLPWGDAPSGTAIGPAACRPTHSYAGADPFCTGARLGSWASGHCSVPGAPGLLTYLPVNELLPRLGPSTPDCTGLTPDGGDWLALPSLYLNFYLLPSPTSPTP